MTRLRLVAACATVLLLGSVGTAAAETMGEFDNYCVEGLALHQKVKTDCSVHTVYKGRLLCFGNEKARSIVLKNPEESLQRAEVYYSKIKTELPQ